jgi:hypothetical protein
METYGALEQFRLHVMEAKTIAATKIKRYWLMHRTYHWRKKIVYCFRRIQILWRVR